MTEDQQKVVDEIVGAIESFWGPIIEEISRRTGWSSEQIWSYQALGSIQSMERQINRLMAAYEKMAESQQESKPKVDKLLDMSLKALKDDDDWKGEPNGIAT